MHLVDRRANPTGKSLPNRQRFLARAKHQIRNAITEALKRRKLGESGTAYIEVSTEATLRHAYQSAPTNLWRTYATISETHRSLAMRKVADRSQIFPVFHELFAGRRERAA
jgi:uncharacterized sporulation protein YeaH/YhbH (DUF444 family)